MASCSGWAYDVAVMLLRRPGEGLLGGMIELPRSRGRECRGDEAEAIPAARCNRV